MSTIKKRGSLQKKIENFNQIRANELRSRLLLLVDRECNSRYAAEAIQGTSLRINCKNPEELKHNFIFYIQLDNEEYNEATEYPYINKSLFRIWNPIYPRKKRSTRSLKSSPVVSDWSEDENNTKSTIKSLKNCSNLYKSPHEIKYMTPMELKLKLDKQVIKKTIIASYNMLHDLAIRLAIFKAKKSSSLRSGKIESKNKEELSLINCKRKLKLYETCKNKPSTFRPRNTVTYADSKIFESLYLAISPQIFERGNTMRFNTIKHDPQVFRPNSPSKNISLRGSPKKNNILRKSSDITLHIKGVIPENDCE